MAKKTSPLLPATDRLLQALGDRLRLARLRRRLSARQVAERAGMAPATLRHVERGNAGVTIGAYLSVLQVLGMESDLALLAAADILGQHLQDARLPKPRAHTASASRGSAGPPPTMPPSTPASGNSDPAWVIEGGFVSDHALAALLVDEPAG